MLLESVTSSRMGRRQLVLAGTLILVLILLIFSSRSDHAQEWTNTVKQKIAGHTLKPPSPPAPAQLHVLIPADKSEVNICKAVLSATLLDYGVPTLYNWEGSSDKMAKITGALNYVRTLNSTHDEDLILVADGYDLWFQLPAQVLIDRYHEINEDADERLRRSRGQEGSKGAIASQKIIFASQKKCWPGEAEDDISCGAVPESPLPDDLYGPGTDQLLTDESNPWRTMRQRWLNAGVMLGSVKDLRPFLKRAQEVANLDPDVFGHDQAVFAQVWGEQEHQRTTKHLSHRDETQKHRETPENFKPDPELNYEFGVGLDYESALSIPTVFSEFDSAFITFSKPDSIDQAMSHYNVSIGRTEALDADVTAARPPYSILSSNHIEPPNPWRWYTNPSTKWEEIPLYTNLYTGITPVIIHHNAHRDGMKTRREKWWDRIWFQPMARDLLDARLAQPEERLALDKKGREWWSAISRVTIEKEGFGVQTDDGLGNRGWRLWDELCTESDQNEVFRDGKGMYVEDGMAGG